MGFFSKPSEPQLPLMGLGVPVGALEQCAQHDTEFTVKLRDRKIAFSGEDFDITTPDGVDFMKMKAATYSARERKCLYDMQGTPLLNTRNKPLSMHSEVRIFAGEDDTKQICKVRTEFSFKTKMSIYLTNFDGQDIELKIRGDFYDRKALITWNDLPVARVDRCFMSAGQLLYDKKSYYLTVAPRVDIAIMIAACVCLDDIRATETGVVIISAA